MRVAVKKRTRLRADQVEELSDQQPTDSRSATQPLPELQASALFEEEDIQSAMQPSLSLPRLPSVNKQGLLSSGKYSLVPVKQQTKDKALPAVVDDVPRPPTSLLLIPGKTATPKPKVAIKQEYLLYYRLGMVMFAMLLLVAGFFSLAGMR